MKLVKSRPTVCQYMAYIVRNKKGIKLPGDTLKSHLTDNGQLCFVRALSAPCISLEGKVVHQQFLLEMLCVVFEDPFPSAVEKSTILDGGNGIEKALSVGKMAEHYHHVLVVVCLSYTGCRPKNWATQLYSF